MTHDPAIIGECAFWETDINHSTEAGLAVREDIVIERNCVFVSRTSNFGSLQTHTLGDSTAGKYNAFSIRKHIRKGVFR